MSLRWSDRRAALFAGERARSERATPRTFSMPRRKAQWRFAWGPIVALLVSTALALLALASLRISILRTGYQLAATLQRETELRGRERTAAVDVRVARDPHKLRELAARQGFARPERVIDLSREARGR
jgi:hypothetical protein